MSDDEVVATFRSTWREIIHDASERSGGESLSLGLSGGLDSRAIATESMRQGLKPVTFTYGDIRTYEGRAAARVASTLGLDHEFLPVTPERMLPKPADTALLLEGGHSSAELYDAWFFDEIAAFGTTVLNGHAGGPLWGDEKALGISGRDHLIAALAARYQTAVHNASPHLAREVRPEAERMLLRGITDSVDEWEPDARADAATFWNVHNRQFRWGNMMPNALRRLGLRTEAPFLDSRFLRLSALLTPAQRRNGSLYLRVQREVFPETAEIRRSDDGNAPAHLDHVYWSGDTPYSSQLLSLAKSHPVSASRRAVRRVRLSGGDAVRERTPFARFDSGYTRKRTPFPASEWLRSRPEYARRLADFLEHAVPRYPLDAQATDQAIGKLRRGEFRTLEPLLLARVATLQVWLNEFDRRRRSTR